MTLPDAFAQTDKFVTMAARAEGIALGLSNEESA